MSITIPMQMSLCNVSYDVTSYDIQEGITHLNDLHSAIAESYKTYKSLKHFQRLVFTVSVIALS